MVNFFKVYNIIERDILRRAYYIIDRDTITSKIYYLILKNFLSGKLTETYTVYNLAKEAIAAKIFPAKKREIKKIRKVHIIDTWWYARQLERQGFIKLVGEKGKGRRKKKQIIITHKIYWALLFKLFNEYTHLHPNCIIRIVGKIFPFFEAIPLSNLFLVKDTEEVAPLSKVCARLVCWASKIEDFNSFLNEEILNSFLNCKKISPLIKVWVALAYYISPKTMGLLHEKQQVEGELRELKLWNEEIEKNVNNILKKMRDAYLKSEMTKKIEERLQHYKKLYQKAKKGIWDEEFQTFK